MRIVRRFLLFAALALVGAPLTAPATGAQQQPEFTVTVKKVVVGTGGPSAVTVDCSSDEVAALVVDVLNFDAQGNPVASGADTDFAIEGGAWVLHGSPGAGFECTFDETTNGGASSTAWTCGYTFTPVDSDAEATQIELAGCAAAAGAGTGPVDVTYPGSQEVSEQASTVVFTNTFTTTPLQPIQPAPQVVAQPAFTG